MPFLEGSHERLVIPEIVLKLKKKNGFVFSKDYSQSSSYIFARMGPLSYQSTLLYYIHQK